jgi:hypothetical protein
VNFPDFIATSRLAITASTAVSAPRNAVSNFAIVEPGFGLKSHARILRLSRPLRFSLDAPLRTVMRPFGITNLSSAI